MLCVTRLTWSGHVLLFLYVSLFAPAVFSVDYDPVPPPEAIFEIEELAVKQVKAAWELTNVSNAVRLLNALHINSVAIAHM